MFEEADAVGDARGFLTGTGHSSAFSEEGRAESALGPFPRPEPCALAPSAGAVGRGSERLVRARGRAPAACVASVLIRSGYYIRCHGEERGEREARWRGSVGLPRVAGGARGRAGGDPPVRLPRPLRAPPACVPGVGWRWGPEGQTDRPAALLPDPGTLGQRPKGAFPLHRLAWVYTFLSPGVCTLKHLFNMKEAACAAVIVRPERVAVSSRAVNESSVPSGPGTDDSCGVYTGAYSPRASDLGTATLLQR